MFNLLFLPSVGSFKSAVDTFVSVATLLPRDLEVYADGTSSLYLVECVVPLQRGALQF